MSFIGILILSIDTLFLREMSTLPDLTVAFWRYLIFSIAILFTMFCIARRKMYLAFRNMGYLGIIAGLLWGGSNFCFTAAVQNTAAANVLVINASNTIFSVIFSYFLLGDPILLRTAVTTLVCFGAIVLVFSSEFGGGTEGLVGNLYALAAAVTLGLYLPLCRLKSMTSEASNRKILTTAVAVMDINSGTVPSEHTITELDDIMEVMGYNVIAGFTVSIISAGLGADTLAVTLPSVAYLLINGIVILGLSFCLLSIGPMYVPAAEVRYNTHSRHDPLTCYVHTYTHTYQHPDLLMIFVFYVVFLLICLVFSCSLMFLVETVLGPCWVYLGGK